MEEKLGRMIFIDLYKLCYDPVIEGSLHQFNYAQVLFDNVGFLSTDAIYVFMSKQLSKICKEIFEKIFDLYRESVDEYSEYQHMILKNFKRSSKKLYNTLFKKQIMYEIKMLKQENIKPFPRIL